MRARDQLAARDDLGRDRRARVERSLDVCLLSTDDKVALAADAVGEVQATQRDLGSVSFGQDLFDIVEVG